MAKIITDDGEVIDEVTHEIITRAPPNWKTPWNHDTDHEARATALSCKDPSLTKQQFAKEADINNILAQFLKTGELNLIGSPIYQDVAEEFDLQRTMVTAYEVEQAWNALSPEVRNTLKDPKTFADYVDHCLETGDLQPLRDLGLAPKTAPEPPEPAITPAASTPVAASPEGAASGPKS